MPRERFRIKKKKKLRNTTNLALIDFTFWVAEGKGGNVTQNKTVPSVLRAIEDAHWMMK